MSVQSLPNEILEQVFSNLNPRDLCQAAQVCCRFRFVANLESIWSQEHLWKELSLSHYRKLRVKTNTEKKFDWKKAYEKKMRTERAWQNDSPKVSRHSSNEASVSCMKIASDDTLVTGSFKGPLYLWKISNGAPFQTLEGHSSQVLCLQVDDHVIVSGSSDTTIRIWSRKLGKCIKVLKDNKNEVTSLHLSPFHLISGSVDGTVHIWSFQGDQISTAKTIRFTHPIRCLGGLTTASVLVASGPFIFQLEPSTSRLISCIQNQAMNEHIKCFCIDDSRLVIGTSGSFDNLHVFDIESGKLLKTLDGHAHEVTCVKLEGNRLVSGSEDKSIKVWDIRTWNLVGSLPYHNWSVRSLDFTDSKLISGSFDELIMWEFPVWKQQPQPLVRSGPKGAQSCVIA